MFILRKKWGGYQGLDACHGWLYIDPEEVLRGGCCYLYINRGYMRKPLLVLASSFCPGNRFEGLGVVLSRGSIRPSSDRSVHLAEDAHWKGARDCYQLAQDAVMGILRCACSIDPPPDQIETSEPAPE